MPLHGVKVGPLDPDATADFGQVAATNSARQLIKIHARSHPAVLVRELGRHLDTARTKGLDLAEVRSYLGKLKLENGDPVVPKGARVVGAQVRGEPDDEQVLTFTYETASRRTAKWFAPYTEDALPKSFAAGSEFRRVTEMRDRGVVAFDSEGTQTDVLRHEAAELRRQNQTLRHELEARGSSEMPEEPAGDTRAATQIVEDNERLSRENAEMSERLARLEQLVQSLPGGAAAQGAADGDDPPEGSLTAPEPVEGYDGLNARQIQHELSEGTWSEEQREALLGYERAHEDRRTVVAAIEKSLQS